MSTIPYMRNMTLTRNIKRVREHLGITNADIAARADIAPGSMNLIISNHFRTNGGKESDMTRTVFAPIQSFFSTPVQKDKPSKRVDLFALMKCARCEFRSRAEDGCVKFSLTKADINSGVFITTLHHGAYALSRDKLCPYAG